jgi:hypothetical protein
MPSKLQLRLNLIPCGRWTGVLILCESLYQITHDSMDIPSIHNVLPIESRLRHLAWAHGVPCVEGALFFTPDNVQVPRLDFSFPFHPTELLITQIAAHHLWKEAHSGNHTRSSSLIYWVTLGKNSLKRKVYYISSKILPKVHPYNYDK